MSGRLTNWDRQRRGRQELVGERRERRGWEVVRRGGNVWRDRAELLSRLAGGDASPLTRRCEPYLFSLLSSLISNRRPRVASAGGACMLISSTPFRNDACALSAITPSGSGIVR